MSAVEWAILSGGEIVNVVMTEGGKESAQRVADMMEGTYTVRPLDSLPEATKQRYRYWDERP